MRRRGETVGVVDFGSREIRVLIARQDDGDEIAILGHGAAPGRGCVSQGVVQDRNAAQAALRQALTQAERAARVKVHSLFCGINGRNVETFIREGNVKIEHDVVEQEHMLEARDIASRDILAAGKRITSSITAQEWYLDDLRVQNPLGIRGQVLKTRMHFAQIPAVIEENLAACIDSLRLELEDLIFSPLAAAIGCLTPEDRELGAAVLDLGRSTTGLAVYRDFRILGSHCFSWGGYHLTRDIAAGLQVSFDEADSLILEHGMSDRFVRSELGDRPLVHIPGQSADEGPTPIKLKTVVPGAPSTVDSGEIDVILYERAHELLVKVRQHVQSRGLSKSLVRGVVLTGGASKIRNMVAVAEAVFQTPCRIGKPVGIQVGTHELLDPEYSTAVGIARHAFQYRAAARDGQIEPRGAGSSVLRRTARFVRRYFL